MGQNQNTDSGWPAILTREQAAAYLAVEPAVVDRLIDRHAISVRYFGQPSDETMRVSRQALDEMLKYGMETIEEAAIAVGRTAETNETSEPAPAATD